MLDMLIHEVINVNIDFFFTFDGKFLLYIKYFVEENLMVDIKTLKIEVVLS